MGQVWREFTGLLTRPPVWLVMLLFSALFAGQSLAMNWAISSADDRPSTTTIGLFSIGFSLVGGLIDLVVGFVLSRRIGGEHDREPPAIARYVLYSLGYGFIFAVLGAIYPFAASGLIEKSPQLFIWFQSALRIAIAVALFSVAVRLVATAHSGNRLRHQAIRSGLELGWYAVYAMLALVPVVLQSVLNLVLQPVQVPAAVAGALIGAAGQTLTLVFSIAVYRCLKQDGESEASVFT